MDEDTERNVVVWLRPASKECAKSAPPKTVAICAAMFFGCYRAAETSSPKIYLAAAEAVLRCYPENVVRAVCDPVNGLPSRSKFLPSIAEIKKACEKANGTWRPKNGTLSPAGYVYDSSKPGGLNFLANPQGRKVADDDD
jgi:hypothetical protein